MTVIANAPFHPRGCTTICQSDTPCLCIMTFRISWRVGYAEKNHLRLHYHEVPAADTLIASGLLSIKRTGRSSFLVRFSKAGKAITCIPLSLRGFFLYYAAFESWIENGFLTILCSHFESRWAVLKYFWLRQILRGFVTVLVSDKSSCLPVCGF